MRNIVFKYTHCLLPAMVWLACASLRAQNCSLPAIYPTGDYHHAGPGPDDVPAEISPSPRCPCARWNQVGHGNDPTAPTERRWPKKLFATPEGNWTDAQATPS